VVLLADTACSRQDLGASVGDRKAWSCGFCGHLGLVTLLKTVCGRRMPQIRNQKKGTCQLLSAGVWVPCHTQGQPGSCQTEKQQATSLAGLPTLEAGVSGPLGRMQGAKARKGEKKSGLHTSSGKFTTHTRFAKNRPRLASNARRTSPNGGHARKSLNSFFARRTAGCRVRAPSQDRRSCKSYAAERGLGLQGARSTSTSLFTDAKPYGELEGNTCVTVQPPGTRTASRRGSGPAWMLRRACGAVRLCFPLALLGLWANVMT
jgi:hypothetical protein